MLAGACRSRSCYDYSPLIFVLMRVCIFLTSLAEGRLPEAFGGWSEGRPPRVGLATQHSGGSGHRAGRHYDRSARCSLGGSRLRPPGGLSGTTVRNGTAAKANGSKEAAPQSPAPELRRSKSFARNAAVERREARRPASSAGDPGDPGIGPTARRATGAASRTSACRRSAPLIRAAKRKTAHPGAARKRGQRSVG